MSEITNDLRELVAASHDATGLSESAPEEPGMEGVSSTCQDDEQHTPAQPCAIRFWKILFLRISQLADPVHLDNLTAQHVLAEALAGSALKHKQKLAKGMCNQERDRQTELASCTTRTRGCSWSIPVRELQVRNTSRREASKSGF